MSALHRIQSIAFLVLLGIFLGTVSVVLSEPYLSSEYVYGLVAAVGVLIVGYLSMREYGLNRIPYSPAAVFLMAYVVANTGPILVFLWYRIHGVNATIFIADMNNLHGATLMVFGGIIAFAFGLMSPFGAAMFRHLPSVSVDQRTNGSVFRVSGWIVMCLLIFSVLLWMKDVEWSGIQRGVGQWERDPVSYRLSLFSALLIPSIGIRIVSCYNRSGRLFDGLSTVAVSAVVLISYASGSRRNVLFILMMMMTLAWSYRTRISFRRLLLVFFGAVFFNSIVVVGRSSGTFAPFSLLARFLSMGTFERVMVATLNFMPVTGVLTQTMNYIPSTEPYYGGLTYLGSLANVLVPYSLAGIYPVKPPVLWFKETYYPHLSTIGYDFSLTAEAYMNFGFIGPAMVMFVLAIVLSGLSKWVTNGKSGCNYNGVFFSFVVSGLVFGLRTDSNTIVKLIVYFSAWTAVIIAVSRAMVVVRPSLRRSLSQCDSERIKIADPRA